MSRRLGFIYLLACHTIKLPFRSPQLVTLPAFSPLHSLVSNPLFVAIPPHLPFAIRSDANLPKRRCCSIVLVLPRRRRRLVESSLVEEIRKSWKAGNGKEEKKEKSSNRELTTSGRENVSRYYSCTGKLCLPVSRKKLFFPSPDTLPQTEFFSLFPSFILSRNPEKYFSTRSFSRVYAIPRSMGRRGRMGEEKGKSRRYRWEEDTSSEESGKNTKRLFLFLVSQPPPPPPLSAEVSTHNRFMKQPRGDCSRWNEDGKRKG